jgi:murein DD-endopeptidase MepM/ murein hydrolase activator NlpD
MRVTTALLKRRTLVGAVLASTMCSGVIAGSASAAEPPSDRPTDTRDAHRLVVGDAAPTIDHTQLVDPSTVLSTTDGAVASWPVKGRLTSKFGRRYGRLHRGIDVAAPVGTPIRAMRPGTVAFAGWKGGYGQTVDIAHGGGAKTRSAHQSELLVRKGEHVERGQIIGRVGTTGSSTGPHLHFELRVQGAALDPLEVLPARR